MIREKKDSLHMVLQSQFLKNEINSFHEKIQNTEIAYNQLNKLALKKS